MNTTLQNVSDFVGILGFLLSPALAINEIVRRTKRLSISHIDLYPIRPSNDDAFFFVRAIVKNASSEPVNLISVDLVFKSLPPLTPMTGEQIIISASSEIPSQNRRAYSELTNTPLPLTLAPYEAREIVAVYCIRSSESSASHYPSWLRNPPALQTALSGIRQTFRLESSRRFSFCSEPVIVRNPDVLLHDLQKRNSRRL